MLPALGRELWIKACLRQVTYSAITNEKAIGPLSYRVVTPQNPTHNDWVGLYMDDDCT